MLTQGQEGLGRVMNSMGGLSESAGWTTYTSATYEFFQAAACSQ